MIRNSYHSHSSSNNTVLVERLLLRLAKKWVAGNNVEDALVAAKAANLKGQNAILNYLGESYTEDEKVNQTLEEYYNLLEILRLRKIEGCISVKPSQLGLSIKYDLCLKNLKVLAERAMQFGRFMWIDMESTEFTDDTLAIYLELLEHYCKYTGVAIQSSLRRSASDLLHLIEVGGNVRLVKGAYHENEQNAFQSNADITTNYLRLLKMMFQVDKKGNDTFIFAVATHDSNAIRYAIELWKSSKVGIGDFEFQFLKGIRDELKKDLIQRGFKVAEYIPYGKEWVGYSIRRLRERKRNIFLLARSLVDS